MYLMFRRIRCNTAEWVSLRFFFISCFLYPFSDFHLRALPSISGSGGVDGRAASSSSVSPLLVPVGRLLGPVEPELHLLVEREARPLVVGEVLPLPLEPGGVLDQVGRRRAAAAAHRGGHVIVFFGDGATVVLGPATLHATHDWWSATHWCRVRSR